MHSKDMSYLFWKYENYLRQTEQPICADMSEREYRDATKRTNLTIEHIASQTPEALGIIRNVSILPALNEAFLEEHINRLGNLTFDPASANSSKGNSNIQLKNSNYFKKAPYKTQNELDSFIIDGKWSIGSIEARGKKIIKFCLQRWNPEYLETP
jgi:hypothetical protein